MNISLTFEKLGIVQAGRGRVLFYGQEPTGNIEASDTEDRLETELRIIFGGLLFQGACWSEDTKKCRAAWDSSIITIIFIITLPPSQLMNWSD